VVERSPSAVGEFPRTRIEPNRQDLRFCGIAEKGDRPSQQIRDQVPRERGIRPAYLVDDFRDEVDQARFSWMNLAEWSGPPH
jgi:hypothetical protein